MRRFLSALLLATVVAGLLPTGSFAADDWDVANGHFFTQTGGGTGKGFVVSDADGVRFWSEFKRLGGVQAVGYPASQRFSWDGFTVQVFQRVIFQWRPESQSAAFVNVFDRLSDLGKNDWLYQARQTPRPKDWNEAGKAWDAVVRDRLAVLDAYPAIKAKYNSVVGDPIQANGLPTSDVTDMGSHFALRCQRVLFQQWKEDVPWAKMGQVTMALGGDIAKEANVLSDAAALQPTTPDATVTIVAPSTSWKWHDDAEKRFKVPADWIAQSAGGGAVNRYLSPDRKAVVYYMARFRMGAGFKVEEFLITSIKATASDTNFTFGAIEPMTINGHPAVVARYDTKRGSTGYGAAIQNGVNVYFINPIATTETWDKNGPILMEIVQSFEPKAAD